MVSVKRPAVLKESGLPQGLPVKAWVSDSVLNVVVAPFQTGEAQEGWSPAAREVQARTLCHPNQQEGEQTKPEEGEPPCGWLPPAQVSCSQTWSISDCIKWVFRRWADGPMEDRAHVQTKQEGPSPPSFVHNSHKSVITQRDTSRKNGEKKTFKQFRAKESVSALQRISFWRHWPPLQTARI